MNQNHGGSMLWRADLHCHTTYSDGLLSPAELVDLALKQGLHGLSVCDHDTVFAYRELLHPSLAEKIKIGSGIELSCALDGRNIHLLGYDFLPQSPLLLDLYYKHKERRKLRNSEMVEKLKKRGLDIVDLFEQFQIENPEKVIGRPHLAACLMKKKYVASMEEAFRMLLGENGSCYVPGAAFTVEEAFDAIKRSKGKLFIAHPYLLKPASLLKKLLVYPFDGIEVYYAHLRNVEPFLKIANDRGWLISGGSDFHGENKPNASLGSSWVEEDKFSAIFENRKEYQYPLMPADSEKLSSQ